MRKKYSRVSINKMSVFIIGSALITFALIFRLFQLQIISHNYYQDIATREQFGLVELPAQRGEIIIKDYHSDEEFLIATNTTLNLLYADPALIKDPSYIADKVVPLLFDVEAARDEDDLRIEELAQKIPLELTEEEVDNFLKPKTDNELATEYKQDFVTKISQKQRPQILLATDLEIVALQSIKALSLNGIEIVDDDVYAYPPEIQSQAFVADEIAEYVEIPSSKLSNILKGENRYVVLARKLDPDISELIQTYKEEDSEDRFNGLGMNEEYFRYYPEVSLAANIIGYVDSSNIGQYGIESSFNTQLEGTAGKFQTKRDSIGRQITVGESVLEAAVNGDDILLTIDRSIQLKVEQILAKDTESYRADSGQVLVIDPETGGIIAMAHYPSFDPNEYGEVFKKIKIDLSPEEVENLFPTKDAGVYYFYRNEVTLDRYLIFEEKNEEGNLYYTRYENFVGPEVYHNKIVSWPYEPGSVFKTIAMSIAIDDGEITPNSTFVDEGPIGVDWNPYIEDYDFFIKNSHGYFGLVDMNTVLGESLNTGMTYVAKTMGAALFYNYMEKYGFLDRTDIEFEEETTGKVEYFEDWTESELATHAFGQGITVTMIQMANAYAVIANGGVLMQPHIVKEVRHDDGRTDHTEPYEIRRVISEDTASKISAMLVKSVEEGVASRGGVDSHFVAGKTGTSQTYKHGRVLSGTGTTITSFAGFGPINNPRFVILVKFDHPRSSEWGSDTAAPTFSKIADYLMDYYNIAPDKSS